MSLVTLEVIQLQIVDAKTVAEAETWAQQQLEEEDMDMD